MGSIFGAMVLRSVAFNFRVFNEGSPLGFLANPLYQPLFEGIILLPRYARARSGSSRQEPIAGVPMSTIDILLG